MNSDPGADVTSGRSPSPARRRASDTTSMSLRADSSSAGSRCSRCGSGTGDTSSIARSPGRKPQISSVTNGITGCASATVRSSTHKSVADTSRRAVSSSPYSRALAASTYQSQKSFQMNPYSPFTAAAKS